MRPVPTVLFNKCKSAGPSYYHYLEALDSPYSVINNGPTLDVSIYSTLPRVTYITNTSAGVIF